MTDSDSDSDADSALRSAIERAGRREGGDPTPEFSPDGGVTVSDRWGRSARIQPLGGRVRVSLAVHERLVAEGEVDTAELIGLIEARENPYDAVTDALDVENGPGYRSQ